MRRFFHFGSLFLLFLLLADGLPVPAAAAPPDGRLSPATASQGGRIPDQERRLNQELRFVDRVIALLTLSASQATAQVIALDRQLDAVTPLEPTERGRDLRDLREWYRTFQEWLGMTRGTLEGERARLLEERRTKAGWSRALGQPLKRLTGLGQNLGQRAERYAATQEKLARLFDRRRSYEERLRTIEEQLAVISEQLAEGKERNPEVKRKTQRLRREQRTLQTELLSLPDITDDILKHYTVLIERARLEDDLLAIQAELLASLLEVAPLTGRAAGIAATDIRSGYRQAITTVESLGNRLGRLQEELEQRQENVSPAGTLRQMDRSADLDDFYDGARSRCATLRSQFQALVGDLEYEQTETLSIRGE